jgi:hypothetical protein
MVQGWVAEMPAPIGLKVLQVAQLAITSDADPVFSSSQSEPSEGAGEACVHVEPVGQVLPYS